MEVDEQSYLHRCQPHIREQLRLVNWRECLDRLHFNHNLTTYEQIKPIAHFEYEALVVQRQLNFRLEWYASPSEFLPKAH